MKVTKKSPKEMNFKKITLALIPKYLFKIKRDKDTQELKKSMNSLFIEFGWLHESKFEIEEEKDEKKLYSGFQIVKNYSCYKFFTLEEDLT